MNNTFTSHFFHAGYDFMSTHMMASIGHMPVAVCTEYPRISWNDILRFM